MRKVTLICYGKLKTPGMADAVAEFAKRLTKYTDFQVIELKPIIVAEKSESIRKMNQAKEAQEIEKYISGAKIVWCLDETGKSLPTDQWANHFKNYALQGSSEMVFVIGSGLGLSKEILKKSTLVISLGAQTLSHELARLVFTEQLYRVFTVISGHPYHNHQ